MEQLKRHKKEIIISLLTGVFLFYFQPLLSYVGDLFINTILTISDSFSNTYYYSVATNDPNSFSDWTYFLQIYVISFIILYFVQSVREKRIDYKRRIQKNLNTLTQFRDRLKQIDQPKTKDELQKEKAQIEEQVDRVEANIKSLGDSLDEKDNRLLVFCILSGFLIILLFSVYAMTKSVSDKNTGFRNELIKLEPFVPEIEIKKLKADWVNMKTKTDYEKVSLKLEMLKQNTVKK